jgi:hypothetical protein
MIIHHRMNVQVTRNRCLDRAQEFQKLAAALSPEHYTRHLLNILPPAAQILLITLDYPQQEMADPPFAVFAKFLLLSKSGQKNSLLNRLLKDDRTGSTALDLAFDMQHT